jgi:hypothetical protein
MARTGTQLEPRFEPLINDDLNLGRRSTRLILRVWLNEGDGTFDETSERADPAARQIALQAGPVFEKEGRKRALKDAIAAVDALTEDITDYGVISIAQQIKDAIAKL